MHPFLVSTGLVAVAEIGDKTDALMGGPGAGMEWVSW